jgi:nucleoid DNA-binding protein|tara:strand:+ start:1362 stop:1595 length:234 start_codon:yes stop_codon:yes gene_type:complete
MENKSNRSYLKDIVNEISHDLGINKSVVKKVLTEAFKEIALILILRGKPVMIRRFVKFVVALKTIKKIKEQLESKEK